VVAAGGRIYASDINRRIGTTTATTNGSATSSTTESVVDTITVSVVAGRRYRIKSVFPHNHSVANDRFFVLIREGTTTAGTQLTYDTTYGHTTGQTDTVRPEVDWTASSTGSQSFCVTARRTVGTGTLTPVGSATQPRSLTVELAE
jgi:hypothetical protein